MNLFIMTDSDIHALLPSSALDELAGQGYTVLHSILPVSLTTSLLQEAQQMFEKGAFREAGIGKGTEQAVHKAIRGDSIVWFQPESLSTAQATYLEEIEQLRQMLNREIFLGARSFECHYAVYPAGSYYKRHVDNFRGTGNRILSCILYLNPEWKEEDGGILRIYHSENDYTDILPQAGTLVLFRSQILEHEVLASKRERYSVTGWMRNDIPL